MTVSNYYFDQVITSQNEQFGQLFLKLANYFEIRTVKAITISIQQSIIKGQFSSFAFKYTIVQYSQHQHSPFTIFHSPAITMKQTLSFKEKRVQFHDDIRKDYLKDKFDEIRKQKLTFDDQTNCSEPDSEKMQIQEVLEHYASVVNLSKKQVITDIKPFTHQFDSQITQKNHSSSHQICSKEGNNSQSNQQQMQHNQYGFFQQQFIQNQLNLQEQQRRFNCQNFSHQLSFNQIYFDQYFYSNQLLAQNSPNIGNAIFNNQIFPFTTGMPPYQNMPLLQQNQLFYLPLIDKMYKNEIHHNEQERREQIQRSHHKLQFKGINEKDSFFNKHEKELSFKKIKKNKPLQFQAKQINNNPYHEKYVQNNIKNLFPRSPLKVQEEEYFNTNFHIEWQAQQDNFETKQNREQHFRMQPIDRNEKQMLKRQRQIQQVPSKIIKYTYEIKKQFKDIIVFNKKLGQGTFGSVYEGLNKTTKQKVAVKVVNYKHQQQFKEVLCLKKIKNQYIIRLDDYCIEKNQKTMYLVFEFCPQNLAEYIKKLQQNLDQKEEIVEKVKLAEMLIEAMNVLYLHKIIHRDLKFQNILIKDKKLKIADFGLARELNPKLQIQSKRCGTPYTMSPQVYFRYNSQNKKLLYSFKSDIFSLGVILHLFLYKTHPFNEQAADLKILNRINTLDLLKKYQSQYKLQVGWIEKLIKGALKYQADRLCWEQVMEIYNSRRILKKPQLCKEQNKRDKYKYFKQMKVIDNGPKIISFLQNNIHSNKINMKRQRGVQKSEIKPAITDCENKLLKQKKFTQQATNGKLIAKQHLKQVEIFKEEQCQKKSNILFKVFFFVFWIVLILQLNFNWIGSLEQLMPTKFSSINT